jgi:hypothetical protein
MSLCQGGDRATQGPCIDLEDGKPHIRAASGSA